MNRFGVRCSPLQRHPVPKGILFQYGSNYFLLPAEIKLEAQECLSEGIIVGIWNALVLGHIETAFKFKKH